MVRYGQTISTVKYGLVTVRCKRLEIAYFLFCTKRVIVQTLYNADTFVAHEALLEELAHKELGC